MFTEEEKIRAIELYFKYGKKLAPVVRELGYPSKRNLRRWIRSWEAGGGAKESIRHKHRYSDEQKQVAIYQCYGYRRLHAMLKHEGLRLSEKVVRRLMVEEQLVVSRNRRRRYSSYCGEIGPTPDNLIARDFKAEQPNQKWLTDITEFQLPAGKVWLSPVVDCFDGKVVSWSLSTRPDAELVNTMLDNAVETLNAGERPVIHSDRGGHYRWPGWLERVNAAGLIRSMSRKGCSPDNAACEGFFGRLKTEMYYGRKWSGITPEKFMQHVDAYIRWYNERRIKLSLGAVSPEMYHQQCGLA
ncbi:IS3 family transposase [Salmonella enterica]|nr:IS3 family transposase [Salmonella enterica]EBS7467913.1 IS3 family transposase [Salmonella enterica]EEU6052735.1 IS3 family transposase [Salmonella enterica]